MRASAKRISVHFLDFCEAADWGVTADRAETGDELADDAAEADPDPETGAPDGPALERAEVPETGLLPLMFTDEITCLDMPEPTALEPAARLFPFPGLDSELPMPLVPLCTLLYLERPILLVALRMLWAIFETARDLPLTAESKVELIFEAELRPPVLLDRVDWMLLPPWRLSIDRTLPAPGARLLRLESSVDPNLEPTCDLAWLTFEWSLEPSRLPLLDAADMLEAADRLSSFSPGPARISDVCDWYPAMLLA